MDDFLRFFDAIANKHGFALNIRYSSIIDWHIVVEYKVTSSNYGETVLCVQDCDIELAFAKAHVELKEWLLENKGGY